MFYWIKIESIKHFQYIGLYKIHKFVVSRHESCISIHGTIYKLLAYIVYFNNIRELGKNTKIWQNIKNDQSGKVGGKQQYLVNLQISVHCNILKKKP